MNADDWGSWEEDRVHKYVRGMDIPVEERLAWIESMLELALERGAELKPPRDEWGRPLDGQRV